jgi:hypothetical protein
MRREECRLGTIENTVPRKIFGPERDRRIQHKEELYYLYFSSFLLLFWRNSPTRTRAASILRFLDHTQLPTTFGRTLWTRNRTLLYSSPVIIRVIKLEIMRWAADVARTGKRRGV